MIVPFGFRVKKCQVAANQLFGELPLSDLNHWVCPWLGANNNLVYLPRGSVNKPGAAYLKRS